MIMLCYQGAAQLDFPFSAPVWGALSTIPFLYILFVELDRVLHLLLIATWGVHSIAFIFNVSSQGFDATGFTAQEIGYTVADVVAICIFGLKICVIARMRSFEDDPALAEFEGGHDAGSRIAGDRV